MSDGLAVPCQVMGKGGGVILRPLRPDDAASVQTLDLALAKDGRGMVLAPHQVRSVEDQRNAIEAMLAAAERGSASLKAGAEVDEGGEPRLVATASLSQLEPTLCSHVGVFGLGVHPEYQGQGLGRALMTYLIAHAEVRGLRRLELYVRADNPRAIGLYRSLGFALEGTRRRFSRLANGTYVDDHIMVRFLDAR
ncbi:MAG: GNAT family N-acetyltransferase [Myxococcota bacterium]